MEQVLVIAIIWAAIIVLIKNGRIKDDVRVDYLSRLLATEERLNSLRDSCFLTNEKGHRVQYWNASEEVQSKAEGNVS